MGLLNFLAISNFFRISGFTAMMLRKVYLAVGPLRARLFRIWRSSWRILEAALVVIRVPAPETSPEMSL